MFLTAVLQLKIDIVKLTQDIISYVYFAGQMFCSFYENSNIKKMKFFEHLICVSQFESCIAIDVIILF